MSSWTWDDLVNMRAYQPVERRAAEPEWQPHDPQDYRDRYPMAPDPSLLGMINPARSTGIGGILESPPLAGPSRGVAAVIRGENPLRATADMTGASPELWEELQARGVNPLLALGAEVAVPSMLSVIGDVSDVADVGRWAASNWDNLAPLAASLLPRFGMTEAMGDSWWWRALRELDAGYGHEGLDILEVITRHSPGAKFQSPDYIQIPSGSSSFDLARVSTDPDSARVIEIFSNGNTSVDDLARIVDLADAGGYQLTVGAGEFTDGMSYDLLRRLGFVEEELGGSMVRVPLDQEPLAWYGEMYSRLAPDDPTELRRAAGLVPDPGETAQELRLLVEESDLDFLEKSAWQDIINSAAADESMLDDVINAMTQEGIIPRIPGEDFVNRGARFGDGFDPEGDSLAANWDALVNANRGRDDLVGVGPTGLDFDELSEWAKKVKQAQDDAIRRGSPYTTEEWARFLDVEGVRMPDGSSLYDEAGHLKPAARDVVSNMHGLLGGSMELPVELTTEQIADLIRSELGRPINPSEVQDFDRVLTGIQDNMLMQDNAISLLRSTDVELTPRIAGNVLESFFAIRPEDIGRTGDELIEWMDSVQRAYAGTKQRYDYSSFFPQGATPGGPRYNVNEVLNRGLADLKILASRPTASGNTVADYDLLAAVRRMGSDADGLPRNLWDVVNDLHQIYPDVPLEQLESVAEMALL